MPFARVGELQLYYEWAGNQDRPVVVLINGLLTDTSSWTPTVAALRDRYRVLTYDCRGQGRSDKPGPEDSSGYRPWLHAQDLSGLLGLLGVEQAHAIGLSSGGCVALEVAAQQPDLFRSLTVVSAYARADTILRLKLQSWVSAMEIGGAPLRFDVATPYVWGASFLERHFEVLRPFREKAVGISLEPAINLIRGAMEHDVSDRLGRIAAPVLVVVGEEDILTPLSYARELVARLPRAKLQVMPGAGHAALLEQPEEFIRMGLSFLAEVESLGGW